MGWVYSVSGLGLFPCSAVISLWWVRCFFSAVLFSCSTFHVTTPNKPARPTSQTEEVDVDVSAEGELLPHLLTIHTPVFLPCPDLQMTWNLLLTKTLLKTSILESSSLCSPTSLSLSCLPLIPLTFCTHTLLVPSRTPDSASLPSSSRDIRSECRVPWHYCNAHGKMSTR